MQDVLGTLLSIERLLKRLVERPEPPIEKDPAAVDAELPESSEPLGTWILTDQRVRQVEEAIEQEQRVRGRAYGG